MRCTVFHFLYFLPYLFPSLSVQAVVTELHLAGLVTGEDIKKISDLNDVVRVQSARLKSSTKMANSAEILEKHGLTRESRYLKGNQTSPAINLFCETFLVFERFFIV